MCVTMIISFQDTSGANPQIFCPSSAPNPQEGARATGISRNFVGRIKGAKCPFDLQFLTWDFS